MNDYDITVEEVVVHHATVKASSPQEAFAIVAQRYETGEFDDSGECQETRVAVRTPSGETLIDFVRL